MNASNLYAIGQEVQTVLYAISINRLIYHKSNCTNIHVPSIVPIKFYVLLKATLHIYPECPESHALKVFLKVLGSGKSIQF